MSELETVAIISHMNDLQGTGTQIGKRYEGVTNEKELLTGSNNINLNQIKILRELQLN